MATECNLSLYGWLGFQLSGSGNLRHPATFGAGMQLYGYGKPPVPGCATKGKKGRAYAPPVKMKPVLLLVVEHDLLSCIADASSEGEGKLGVLDLLAGDVALERLL